MQGDTLFVQQSLGIVATILNETTVDLFSLGRLPDTKEDEVSDSCGT